MLGTAPQTAAIAPGAPVGMQLYRLLRERVLSADLAPGARLSESEIAASYAVSRQPVREAFIKLAEEGLLEIRPQRGTYVRRISVPAVLSARFVREAIEADIVRLVAARPDPATLAALDDLLARQRDTLNDPDAERFIALDDAFHSRLAEAAGQAGAWSLLDGLKTQMTRVRHLGARRFPREKLVRQHAAVVQAIRARDPGAAEAAMRTHLREILNDLPAIADAQPAFFDQGGQPGPLHDKGGNDDRPA
jgi:DNA-binding GntR family transcriptional regulator